MKKLVFATLLLVAFVSCNKQQPQIDIRQENVNERNEYNAQISELAAVLNKSLIHSSDFRSTVKIEAEKKFDGDINVLFSDLVKKTIKVETKSGNTQLSIGDYLNGFYNVTKSSSQSIVDSLQKTYPLLQIAIPVHSDEWDGSTPLKVAYVPSPFDEKNTTTIPAICPDGSWVSLDAKSEPNEPVIVLSQNERSSGTSIIRDSLIPLKPVLKPDTPQNLTAVVANDYIELNWDKVTCDTYRIYRKGPNDTDFARIGSSNSATYNDKAIVANCVYFYYVVAVNTQIIKKTFEIRESSSDQSNTIRIQAPNIPEPLSYFNVVCQGDNIEFRWNDDGIPDSKVIINYKNAASQNNYSLLHTSPSSSVNWTYKSPVKGSRVVYQARRQHNVGLSNPTYSFIYPPYRNTANLSQVRVKSISIDNLNDVEAWYSGAPEFYIKIFKSNIDDNGILSTVDVGGEYRLGFSDRTNSQDFDDLVYSWLVNEQLAWSDAITIYMVEGDNNLDWKFQAGAEASIPDLAKLDLTFTVAPRIDSKFSTSGQNCGCDAIYYFENPEKSLFFSYGIEVKVDDK